MRDERFDDDFKKFNFGRQADENELSIVQDSFNLTTENVDICKSVISAAVIALREWNAWQPTEENNDDGSDGGNSNDDGGGRPMSRVDVLTDALTNLLGVLDGVKTMCDTNAGRLNTILNNKIIYDANLKEMRKLTQTLKQRAKQKMTQTESMKLKAS